MPWRPESPHSIWHSATTVETTPWEAGGNRVEGLLQWPHHEACPRAVCTHDWPRAKSWKVSSLSLALPTLLWRSLSLSGQHLLGMCVHAYATSGIPGPFIQALCSSTCHPQQFLVLQIFPSSFLQLKSPDPIPIIDRGDNSKKLIIANVC